MILIAVTLLFPIFFIILSMVGSATISDGLLAITAIIIAWYTTETEKMRKEVTKQNVLFARPVVVVKLMDKKICLKNDGKGPALNVKISDIFTKFKHFEDANGQEDPSSTYHIPTVSYLVPNSNEEAKFFKNDTVNELKGTVSDPNEFFKFGKISSFIITYNDIENIKYQTKIEIESGELKNISFE